MPEWKEEITKQLAGLQLSAAREAEIVEEVAQHLEDRYRELLVGGATEAAAYRTALEEISEEKLLAKEVERVEHQATQEPIVLGAREKKNILAGLWQDIRYGLRMLRKNPGFTAVAVITLALGIGANTAIFTVVNTALLHPLPYPDSSRIVNVTRPGGGLISGMMFTYWQQRNLLFEDLTAYDAMGIGVNLSGGDRPELVQGVHVSRNYFRLFGANPILGRTFAAEEDRPGGTHVVLMSYGLWQRRFGGVPSLLGKTITLGGVPHTVIGILSPSFQPYPPVDVWMPLQADPSSTNQAHTLTVSGRLPGGKTLAGANSQMAAVGKQYVQAHPEQLGNDDKLQVTPMQQQMTGGVRPALLILLGAVGLVLLIACANVANLLLARAAGRQREIAIRAAIGAGRGKIVRQLLTESLLLALTGGVLGLALGSWGVRALLALTPGDLPRVEEMAVIPALDPWVAGFTVLLSLVTGILFGLLPSLQVSRADLTSILKESGGRTGSGLKHHRARGILVSAEVAMAVVLLCGAVLLIRSFAALHNVEPGFDARNLLTLRVSLADTKYASASVVDRMTRQVVERVERMPGVEAAAMSSELPFENGIDMIFNIPGRPPVEGYKFTGDEQWRLVSAHYFNALRIPLRSGRLFRDQEAARIVLINEAMAGKYWPGANPVGQTLLIGAGLGPDFEEGPTEIVGVVGNVRESGLDYDPPPVMYQLQSQVPDGAMKTVNGLLPASVAVRTKPGVAPLSLSQAVQEALLAGDTQLPATKVHTMEYMSLTSRARQNFNLLLLGVFAAIALLLAAVGIYGVMSYTVAQRTHEFGIRMALGAERADVVRLVVRHALTLTLIGIAAGLAGAFALTRFLASMLYRVRPTDPLTFVGVSILLAGVALLASYIPARRATSVDPMVALRYE
jgi:predicted permease